MQNFFLLLSGKALVKGSVVVLGVEEVTSLALKSHRFESGCGRADASALANTDGQLLLLSLQLVAST